MIMGPILCIPSMCRSVASTFGAWGSEWDSVVWVIDSRISKSAKLEDVLCTPRTILADGWDVDFKWFQKIQAAETKSIGVDTCCTASCATHFWHHAENSPWQKKNRWFNWKNELLSHDRMTVCARNTLSIEDGSIMVYPRWCCTILHQLLGNDSRCCKDTSCYQDKHHLRLQIRKDHRRIRTLDIFWCVG